MLVFVPARFRACGFLCRYLFDFVSESGRDDFFGCVIASLVFAVFVLVVSVFRAGSGFLVDFNDRMTLGFYYIFCRVAAAFYVAVNVFLPAVLGARALFGFDGYEMMLVIGALTFVTPVSACTACEKDKR